MRKAVKAGLDKDMARRKREDRQIQLRKVAREDQLRKKRMGLNRNYAKDGEFVEYVERDAETLAQIAEIPTMIANMSSSDFNLVLESTVKIRKLLSIDRDPPIDEVIAAGAVPKIIEFLTKSSHPTLVFEAAWALTNVASGTSDHTKLCIQAGAVPILIELLSHDSEDVREQAVWALGNIAGDSADTRDYVMSFPIVQGLIHILTQRSRPSLLRNAVWTFSNLCRGKRPPPDFSKLEPAIPCVSQYLHSPDEDILSDTCWAFSYLSDDSEPENPKIQAVIRSGIVKRIIELMMHPLTQVKVPALRTIGNIVTGNDIQTQCVVNLGGLTALCALLTNDKKNIRKEACWTISNITAGSADQIQAVLEHNIFPPLIHLLKYGEHDVRKEAGWAISNATTSGTPEHIKYLVSQGCIAPLCDMILSPEPKIALMILEALENILRVGKIEQEENGSPENMFAKFIEECGGFSNLEQAQHCQDAQVYEKAAFLMRSYWEVEEEVTTGLEPEMGAGDSFAFGTSGFPSAPYKF